MPRASTPSRQSLHTCHAGCSNDIHWSCRIYLYAEDGVYLVPVAVKRADAQLRVVSVAGRHLPFVNNLLQRHAPAFQLADEPTIKLGAVVHVDGLVLVEKFADGLVPPVPGVAHGRMVDSDLAIVLIAVVCIALLVRVTLTDAKVIKKLIRKKKETYLSHEL